MCVRSTEPHTHPLTQPIHTTVQFLSRRERLELNENKLLFQEAALLCVRHIAHLDCIFVCAHDCTSNSSWCGWMADERRRCTDDALQILREHQYFTYHTVSFGPKTSPKSHEHTNTLYFIFLIRFLLRFHISTMHACQCISTYMDLVWFCFISRLRFHKWKWLRNANDFTE